MKAQGEHGLLRVIKASPKKTLDGNDSIKKGTKLHRARNVISGLQKLQGDFFF